MFCTSHTMFDVAGGGRSSSLSDAQIYPTRSDLSIPDACQMDLSNMLTIADHLERYRDEVAPAAL
jgi:hypothetical protein